MDISKFELVLNNYFPKSKNQIGFAYKSLVSSSNERAGFGLPRDKELESYINSKLHKDTNLTIRVFIDRSEKLPNALTIPLLVAHEPNKRGNEDLPIFDRVSFIFSAMPLLIKLGIDGYQDKNGKLVITYKEKAIEHISNPLVIDVFITGGFKKLVSDKDEQLAVILHEIGHWRRKNSILDSFEYVFDLSKTPVFLASFFSHDEMKLVMLAIWLKLMLLVPRFQQGSEYSADNFTKKMGYGHQLANVLETKLPDWSVSKNKVNIIVKIFKTIFYNHPSHKSRAYELRKPLNENIELLSDKLKSFVSIKKLISLIDSL